MAYTQTFAKLPGVFSFQRSLVVTDAPFFNLIGDRFEEHPLMVVRHGLRGTQNVDESGGNADADADTTTTDIPAAAAKGDSAKESPRDAGNIQQTESAKTAHDAQGFVVTFGLRMLDLSSALSSCAARDLSTTKAVRESVEGFANRAKASKGLEEVARRIARNVANGSWLWRNRVTASAVRIDVLQDGKSLASFDALAIPIDRFENYNADEQRVADVLATGLRGDRTANLEVRAFVDFGVRGAFEVFPSQAYIEDKPDGFARPLYKIALADADQMPDATASTRVMGQAALRDQKISNRLRTIDTWYDEYERVAKPIPIEPNGASLELMQFFRRDNKRSSVFDLFGRLNTIDPDTPDGMFCIGAMIRGGVFSGKSEKPDKVGKAGAKTKAKSNNRTPVAVAVVAKANANDSEA